MDFIRSYIMVIIFFIVNIAFIALIVMGYRSIKHRPAFDGTGDAPFDPEEHAGS